MYEVATGASNHINKEIFFNKTPHVSLTMLLFVGRTMHYFNVGANKLYIYDRKNELPLTNDLKATFTLGQFDLFAGDIAAIFSVGLNENLVARERIGVFNSKTGIYDKAMTIVDIVYKKNIVNQNNATALLVEVV